MTFSNSKSNTKFANLESAFKFTVCGTESKVHQSTNKRSNTKPRQNSNIYQNQGVKIDSTRATTKSRIVKEREAKYRTYRKARKTRDGIYQQIVGDAENLRTKLEEYSTEEQRAKQSIIGKIAHIGRIIAKIASKLKIKLDVLISGEVIKDETFDLVETITKNTKRIKK